MKQRKWLIFSIIAVTATLLLSLGRVLAETTGAFTVIGLQKGYEIDRTVKLPGDTLSVKNGLGAITVTGGGQPGEVQVRGTVYLWPWENAQGEAETRVTVSTDAQGARIEGPYQTYIIGPLLFGTIMDLELIVPDGIELDVKTEMGRVTLTDVTGDVRVWAGTGAVAIDGFTGALDAKSNLGRITVRRATAAGKLSLVAGMSSITFDGIPAAETTIRSPMAPSYLYLPADQAYRLLNTHGDPLQSVSAELPYKEGIVGTGTPSGTITFSPGLGSLHIHGR